MSTELKPGDEIIQRHGPFEARWRVERIIDAGAVLRWTGHVLFTGYRDVQTAPNGDQLTAVPEEDFIGRAHWSSVERRLG